jgi:signal peptidase II
MSCMRRPFYFFIFVACGIAADLISKAMLFSWLHDTGTYELIPHVLNLTLAKNKGVAFSMFRDSAPFYFVVLSLLAAAAFTWIYLRCWRTAPKLLIVAIGMLLVGAIGNMIDRAFFGYVRDFIEFVPEVPFVGHWAIFNVADICITVGVAFYFIAELFLTPPGTPPAPPTPVPPSQPELPVVTAPVPPPEQGQP